MGVTYIIHIKPGNNREGGKYYNLTYPKPLFPPWGFSPGVSMPAKRMSKIKPSGTVKIANLVSQMKARGENVISFNVGEPDFDTPAHVVEAAKKALDSGFTHYTPSNGIPELREAIAQHCWETGIQCKAENVMVTPCKQAIFMTMLATIDNGNEVLIPEPAWVSYGPCVSVAGGKPVPIQTSYESGFQLTPEMVQDRVTKKTKMLVLNSPANPTGVVYKPENLKGIAEVAVEKNLLVLSDEIYKKLVYEGAHVPVSSFEGMFERTITVDGFSKSYAMTGWRIGWMVAPKPIFDEVSKLQQHSITCVTSFGQKAAVAALTGPQDSVKKMVDEFKLRRDLIVKLLNDTGQFECRTPEGAFYVFPRFKAAMDSEKFTELLLTKAKVSVTPGSAFGQAGEGHVRFSYAASRDNIKAGIESITKALA
jgi:aspartate aminotransferase